jgi:hypothetical protein
MRVKKDVDAKFAKEAKKKERSKALETLNKVNI